jgi:hypothetical protein
MRSPLNAFRPHIVREALAERERVADAHYDLEKVREAISAAARRGEMSVMLPHGDITIELRGTPAAARLAEWITANGMRIEWIERNALRPCGLKARIGEPVISWGDELTATV